MGLFSNKKKAQASVLEEAKHWYADRYQNVVVQRNILTLVTLLSLVGLAGAVYVVAQISNSRTFEPYVIEVEGTTGITTLVDRQSVEQFQAKESVTRYFLWKYINSRESYDVYTYTYNYSEIVRLLSSSSVFSEFRKSIALENANSPVHLGRTAKRDVKLKSMTFLTPKQAQIRVAVEETRFADNVTTTKHMIITVDFDYYNLDLNTQERFVNPLGLQITGYRIDEDVPQ